MFNRCFVFVFRSLFLVAFCFQGIALTIYHMLNMSIAQFQFDQIFATASWNAAGGPPLFGTLSLVYLLIHEVVKR
jgi:ABC-type phosphate transport system permease subunit